MFLKEIINEKSAKETNFVLTALSRKFKKYVEQNGGKAYVFPFLSKVLNVSSKELEALIADNVADMSLRDYYKIQFITNEDSGDFSKRFMSFDIKPTFIDESKTNDKGDGPIDAVKRDKIMHIDGHKPNDDDEFLDNINKDVPTFDKEDAKKAKPTFDKDWAKKVYEEALLIAKNNLWGSSVNIDEMKSSFVKEIIFRNKWQREIPCDDWGNDNNLRLFLYQKLTNEMEKIHDELIKRDKNSSDTKNDSDIASRFHRFVAMCGGDLLN